MYLNNFINLSHAGIKSKSDKMLQDTITRYDNL